MQSLCKPSAYHILQDLKIHSDFLKNFENIPVLIGFFWIIPD